MDKVLVRWVVVVLMAGLAVGCGSPNGKGANKGKDQPTPPARQGG